MNVDLLVLLAIHPPGMPASIGWFLLAWLFVLGGTVGSFINVVVYRLPAGMSLIRPGSHCPNCESAIRWYDNVPILGWLWLRGRCRDCGARISPRYPIVETIVAAMFFALGWMEIFSGGVNLPCRSTTMADGVAVSGLTLTQLTLVYVYHLLLLCTLLAMALIDLQGRRAPLRLTVPAVVVGLLAPLAWPWLHPVPAFWGLQGRIGALAGVAAGLATGVVLGLLLGLVVPEKQRAAAAAAATIVGLFLGWQAAAMLCVPLLAILLLEAALRQFRPGLRFFPATAWLAAAAFAWILAWRPLITWMAD